jgi:hypothetical protein
MEQVPPTVGIRLRSDRMVYLKSFLTGLSALLATFLIGLAFIFVRARMSLPEGIGFVVGGGLPLLALSFLAFVAAFFWKYRKLR